MFGFQKKGVLVMKVPNFFLLSFLGHFFLLLLFVRAATHLSAQPVFSVLFFQRSGSPQTFASLSKEWTWRAGGNYQQRAGWRNYRCTKNVGGVPQRIACYKRLCGRLLRPSWTGEGGFRSSARRKIWGKKKNLMFLLNNRML